MIRAWRLSPAAYVDRIFSGGGAYRRGGRWNSPGRAVVYLSEALSLSALEVIVHIPPHMLRGYKCVWVDIPENMIEIIALNELPENWKAVPAPESTRKIGDQWFDNRVSPVLKVPSTIIPTENNFVLNPGHPEFNALQIGEVTDFEFDKRLFLPKKAKA